MLGFNFLRSRKVIIFGEAIICGVQKFIINRYGN